MPALEEIKISGFKSIRDTTITLRDVNILVGANAAGKSNFLQLFQMMRALTRNRLNLYVGQKGGANRLLYYGAKITKKLTVEMWFPRNEKLANGYKVVLSPTADDRFIFEEEVCCLWNKSQYGKPLEERLGGGHSESQLATCGSGVAKHVRECLQSWRRYHFHDTSERAPIRMTCSLNDNDYLHEDGSNVAAYLHRLKYSQRQAEQAAFRLIEQTVQLAVPYFGDFYLRPTAENPDMIRLEWRERSSDYIFGPEALSDGSLRFICLAALLNMPAEHQPQIIILDEPELGLHPAALQLVAEMVRTAAAHTQVVLATHSVSLLNYFSPEDVIVVDRGDEGTTFRRLSEENLRHWMEEFEHYGVGDLWEKNVFGGGPW